MKNNRVVFVLRLIHSLIVLYLVAGIIFIYYSALTLQLSILLGIAIISLFIEGTLVILNHGHCPLAFIQRRFGDNVPFFDLILPPKYAKLAVPFFALLTLIGVILLGLRLFDQQWIR